MAAVFCQHIQTHGHDSRHRAFQNFQFARQKTASMLRIVPSRMSRIAKNQPGANARNFTGRLRRLRMTQVAQELHGPRQPFRRFSIFCTVFLQLEHIQNLPPRRQQPAERICQCKCHPLALPVIELVSGRISGFLQV